MMGETAYLKPVMASSGNSPKNSPKTKKLNKKVVQTPSKLDEKHKTGRFGTRSPSPTKKSIQSSKM